MNHPPIPLDHHCNVIWYKDTGIWALEKASGVLTHPNKDDTGKKKSRTLLNAEYLYDEECYWWKNEHQDIQKLYLVHRLDSPTSGVILATSDLKIAHAIKESFLTKKVKKTYYAIVRPKGAIKEGMWKDYLKEGRKDGKVRVWKGNGSIALTQVFIQRKRSGLYNLAMLRLVPQTGRTHQLRVQCALRGISIVGDKNYGDFTFNRKIARAAKVDRLCLHAGEIEMKLEIDGHIINIFADSPIPRSLGKLII